MNRAIPSDVEPEILAKSGEGWTSRKIAEWLRKERGIECSHASVSRVLRTVRADRAEITRSIVREELGKTVLSDIDRLEKHAANLDALADTHFAAAEKDPRVFIAVVSELRKISETKLHFSGADADSANRAVDFPTDFSALTDEQLSRLGRGLPAGGSARDTPPDRFACPECGLEVSEQFPVCPKCGDVKLDSPPKDSSDETRERENADLMKTFEEQRERRK